MSVRTDGISGNETERQKTAVMRKEEEVSL